MKQALLLCVGSAIVGAGLAIGLSGRTAIESKSVAQELPPLAAPAMGGRPLTEEERVNIAVYENVNRSVVNIMTEGFQGERLFLIEVPSKGQGSGSVLDQQGHILTNYHVIDGARQMKVTLFDGTDYEARLVGGDPSTNVAVLKINAPAAALFPVVMGASGDLRVGQRVFAIGNPFGLDRTMAAGIISSLNRSLPSRRNGHSIKSIIQIDAAINPGNSGGPLLDTQGRMIGMNTAIASKTGESAGVGFAIPVNTIARVVPQLIAKGKVERPDAGIGQVYQTEHGLLIATLAPDGPAERAGLQGFKVVRQRRQQGPFVYEVQTVDRSAADLITAVDGKPIHGADDYFDIVESKRPGDVATLTVIRRGQERQVPVRLEAGE